MGGKIVPFCQETQAEKTVARDNKSIRKNKEKNNITVNGNGNWCDKDKNMNKRNPAVQKSMSTMTSHKSIYRKLDTRERK